MAEENNNARLNLKVPPFTASNPLLWFLRLEVQFDLCNITDDNKKFQYTVANLDEKSAEEVMDFLQNPPAANKYKTLKDELISRLSKSERAKIKQLLENEPMGDKTPSQFLRHMRSLADKTTVPDKLLRDMWSSRLPLRTQDILTTQGDDAKLDTLGSLADKLHENSTSQQIASSTSINSIEAQLAAIQQELCALKTHSSRPTKRNFSKDFNRNRSASRGKSQPNDNEVCWFHHKFGEKARRCRDPCKYAKNGSNHQ